MLARALANTCRAPTPDPVHAGPAASDVTGVTVYDQHKGTFEFHPGPIFHTIVLADEINRASPKTQSALLEVMEESRVTVDGVAHSVAALPVIATQNPIEQAGTYRLPRRSSTAS
jgi:MoxR-like ATPase